MFIEKVKQLRYEASQNNGELYESVNKCKWQIYISLSGGGADIHGSLAIIAASYLLSIISKYNDPFMSFKEAVDLVDEEFKSVIQECVSSRCWASLNKLVEDYEPEIFELIPFLPDEYEGEASTPESIVKLVRQIAALRNAKSVADICCGKGNYLIEHYLDDQNNSFYGLDINSYAVSVAKIRSALLNNAITIEQGNAFNIDEKKHDFIFSHFPFSYSSRITDSFVGPFDSFSKTIEQKTGTAPSRSKCDWAFVMSVENRLSDSGMGVCVVCAGALFWNTPGDKAIRKYLVDNHLISSIISLPKGLFDYVSIPTALLIIDKANQNSDIRMINASDCFVKGRRLNCLSEENIKHIISLTTSDDENSKLVSRETIAENDYILNPSRYLEKSIVIENGVKFGEIIKSVTRGAPLTASELDKMNSIQETPYQYLMLSNISNGIIDLDLPYLNKIDEKYEKFCIRNNDLLLSKNGAPYKVAVASVESGKKILANGNLFIIQVDEERANPHYLKAFFSSYDGERLLNSLSTQGVIPSISLSSLKDLVVPLPSMELQNKIAERFLILEDEIKLLELRIKKAKETLRTVIDEGKE